MPNTMKIWNNVCETDPDHTKHVNQRGGFTAIDAQYQVQLATEQFGPVGEGWGYDTVHGTIEAGGKLLSIVDLTLWWGNREQKFGPVRGCAEMVGSRIDTDAPKKAMTDALTKALSHLGFNADVFLGKFDDNKYVAELRKKKNAESIAKIDGKQISTIRDMLNEAGKSEGAMLNWLKVKNIEDIPAGWYSKIIGSFNTEPKA